MKEISAQEVSIDVLLEKYAQVGESCINQIQRRVAKGLAKIESKGKQS